MKQIFLLFSSILVMGCSRPKVFILNDSGADKYFVQKLVNTAFEKDLIGKSP